MDAWMMAVEACWEMAMGACWQMAMDPCWKEILASGYIAQWLERLTADQQVPGSNPGVPSWTMRT